MPNSQLTSTRVPDLNHSADIAEIVTSAIADLESYTCPRFDNTTQRDQAYTAWVAAGGVMEDGMQCFVGDSYQERRNGTWAGRVEARGIVKYATSDGGAENTGVLEKRLPGTHNMTVALETGRAYEVLARGHANINGAAGLVALHVRAARGTIPGTSSPLVATDRVYCPRTGGPGQLSFRTSGQFFQVGTAASNWELHLFGAVIDGGSSMAAMPDARGVLSIAVVDRGPAIGDIPLI